MFKKRIIGFVLSVIAIFSLSLVVLPTQASAKSTLKSFPMRLHRTWYHYDGHGRYDTIHFSAKKIRSAQYYDHKWYHYTSRLHHRNVNSNKITKHPNWLVGQTYHYRGAFWTNTMGWNQTAGDGDSYKVETKRFHYRKIRVLSVAGGAENWISDHFYTHKRIAHKLGNHHFSGELYY
ncbi:hypothetical protein [Secundilactobacillus silagei]|uniref:Uncharacterized protein n=1 Tax=Secundilactobacillus silagei JCM 19001 TaxID=1302250 RepID=A0A1Z5IGD7_9LACO|nr:hypothetical protein [Secundilactobacillus silagei]TDG73395.1 hypothetical protein C5L25_000544 [Secundilactobacillus silagei JCM 19001]GAX00766.1 hypothetical protein IWT126_00781 [Secundilactobacillus silagei JCM 19001]